MGSVCAPYDTPPFPVIGVSPMSLPPIYPLTPSFHIQSMLRTNSVGRLGSQLFPDLENSTLHLSVFRLSSRQAFFSCRARCFNVSDPVKPTLLILNLKFYLKYLSNLPLMNKTISLLITELLDMTTDLHFSRNDCLKAID